ncbi:MAG: nuclear transport factor 2 family protein [Bacteroidota bacterium]
MKRTLIFVFCCLTFCSFGQNLNTSQAQALESPAKLAQMQLDAYNARNIEDFLKPYADSVKIYNFPNTLIMDGKSAMRTAYASMFQRTVNLHCELVNRMVMGDTVIDQERVTGIGDEPLKAIAIYKIRAGEIVEVYFIQGE